MLTVAFTGVIVNIPLVIVNIPLVPILTTAFTTRFYSYRYKY